MNVFLQGQAKIKIESDGSYVELSEVSWKYCLICQSYVIYVHYPMTPKT